MQIALLPKWAQHRVSRQPVGSRLWNEPKHLHSSYLVSEFPAGITGWAGTTPGRPPRTVLNKGAALRVRGHQMGTQTRRKCGGKWQILILGTRDSS